MHSVQVAARSSARSFMLPPPHGAGAMRPARASAPFARDVLAGLHRPQKTIPGTWLHDRRGVAPRAGGDRPGGDGAAEIETAILERCAAQIAAAIGAGTTLVELGAGAYRNTARLLAALDAPKACVAVHGSADASGASIGTLRAAFPTLPMHTLVGELGDPATLAPLRRTPGALGRAARAARPWGRRLGFLPGSTIGHYAPDAAATLLDRIGQTLGSDALLVVGVDSTPDPAELLAVHAAPDGLHAALNRDLLARINRELEGDLEPRSFRHEARHNAELHRIEHHLVSRTWEHFEVLGRRFSILPGESIQTGNAHPYSLSRFQTLARRGGWLPLQYWADARTRFAIHVLERAAA